MSEKIYAHLLRLFPSAFRRHYEEEALRLLRDRLRDERGIFRRLRLGWDLLVDIIGALPQAYRNSYAEVAPASLTPNFDGVPSFQVLRSEPIRRGAIVLACVLSLTTLTAFIYVAERPAPYRPAARNGPISPIEAVLERLNQQMSEDSAGNEGSDAPAPASADTGRLVSATGADSQPAHSSQQIEDARHLDHSQQSVQNQPEGIRVAAQSPSPLNMYTPAPVAAGLSGEWTSRAAGRDGDIPKWFIFKQDRADLSGTGRVGPSEQYPIIHGLVAGSSVTFELNNGRRRFLYDLKFEDRELRGTLSIRSANEMQTAKVWLKRVH